MSKIDQVSETYDRLYEEGGAAGTYRQAYRQSFYYPMFKATLKQAMAIGTKRILEVGCGNGAFAEMLFDQHITQYVGFDFSEKAIELARSRCHGSDKFFVADALDSSSYEFDYDTIICTEVLEHVPDDLAMIRNWNSEKKFVCSVPSFDSKYHVRFFESEEAIKERYEQALRIDRTTTVIHPGSAVKTLWSRLGRHYRHLRSLLTGREMRARWYVFSGTVK